MVGASSSRRTRSATFSVFKRIVAGMLVASVLVGGGLAVSEDASAFTKTHRSDDGKLVLICHYTMT